MYGDGQTVSQEGVDSESLLILDLMILDFRLKKIEGDGKTRI